jgi:DnaJ-class molecular chaperone
MKGFPYEDCWACEGTGRIGGKTCQSCGGTGRILVGRLLELLRRLYVISC